jgi:hypothetical protein
MVSRGVCGVFAKYRRGEGVGAGVARGAGGGGGGRADVQRDFVHGDGEHRGGLVAGGGGGGGGVGDGGGGQPSHSGGRGDGALAGGHLLLPFLDEVQDGVAEHVVLQDVHPLLCFLGRGRHQHEPLVFSFGGAFAVKKERVRYNELNSERGNVLHTLNTKFLKIIKRLYKTKKSHSQKVKIK